MSGVGTVEVERISKRGWWGQANVLPAMRLIRGHSDPSAGRLFNNSMESVSRTHGPGLRNRLSTRPDHKKCDVAHYPHFGRL